MLAWQGLSSIILPWLYLQVYFHQGCWYIDGTNLAHVCAEFAACISYYHSRLTRHCRSLAWSKRILNSLSMRWVWNFYFSATFFCYIWAFKRFSRKQYSLFLSLPSTNDLFVKHWAFAVLVCIWKSTERIIYYVLKSIYILNIRPQIFDNEFPLHYSLRFTQSCGIKQIFIIWKYIYFIDRNNYTELI